MFTYPWSIRGIFNLAQKSWSTFAFSYYDKPKSEKRRSPIGYHIHLLVGVLAVVSGATLDERVEAEQEEHVDEEQGHHADDEDHYHLSDEGQGHFKNTLSTN